MPVIANAQTVVSVEKSISEIEKFLLQANATHVGRQYDGGRMVGITFSVVTPRGERSFLVPVDVDSVYQRLEDCWIHRQIAQRYVNRDQARRTAWRCIRDWIRAQLALVGTGLATSDRVMMAYLETAPGRVIYDDFAQGHVKVLALPAPREAGR